MQKLGHKLKTNGQWRPTLGEDMYQYYNKVKELVKNGVGQNETSKLIRDRNKLKVELINSL